MSIEQTEQIDLATVDKASGEILLTISDHLPWGEYESDHLVLLQDKLNAYLAAIESGDLLKKIPESRGRKIALVVVAKYQLSESGSNFFNMAKEYVENMGFRLEFILLSPN